MRQIDKIIIHCSFTPPSMDIGAAKIRDWHMNEREWSDIGYHYVITRGGLVESGRPLLRSGAHTYGHNENSIGICLVGGMSEKSRKPEFNFTREQMHALRERVQNLLNSHPFATVHGHNEFDSGKECPCFNVQEYFRGL